MATFRPLKVEVIRALSEGPFEAALREADGSLTAAAVKLSEVGLFGELTRRHLSTALIEDDTGELRAQYDSVWGEMSDAAAQSLVAAAKGSAKASSGLTGACMSILKSKGGWVDRVIQEHQGRVEYTPPPSSEVAKLDEEAEPPPIVRLIQGQRDEILVEKS